MIEAALIAVFAGFALITLGILAGRLLRARSEDFQAPDTTSFDPYLDELAVMAPEQSQRVKAAVMAETACKCSCHDRHQRRDDDWLRTVAGND